jgi:hypothetical protein
MIGRKMKCRKISFLMTFVLLSILLCPFMEAAGTPKPSSCHSEPVVPQSNQVMRVCCDNDAVLVQQIHPVVALGVLGILKNELHGMSLDSDSPSSEYPLFFRSTAEHLAQLSVLRM